MCKAPAANVAVSYSFYPVNCVIWCNLAVPLFVAAGTIVRTFEVPEPKVLP